MVWAAGPLAAARTVPPALLDLPVHLRVAQPVAAAWDGQRRLPASPRLDQLHRQAAVLIHAKRDLHLWPRKQARTPLLRDWGWDWQNYIEMKYIFKIFKNSEELYGFYNCQKKSNRGEWWT